MMSTKKVGVQMDKASTKILKILLFIGVFGYLQYYDISRGVHTINSVTAGLMMASAAYLIASLFGILLAIFNNYFIAIVATGALALFLAFKLDEIVASTSWLWTTLFRGGKRFLFPLAQRRVMKFREG